MSYDRAHLLLCSEVVARRFPDPPQGFQPFRCVSSSDLQEQQWQVVILVVVRKERVLGSQKVGHVEEGKMVTQWGPLVTLHGGQDEGVTRIYIISPMRGWVTLSAAAQQGPTFLQKPFHPTVWVATVESELREDAKLGSRHVATLSEGTVVRQTGPFRLIADIVMMPIKHPHALSLHKGGMARELVEGWVTLDTRSVDGNADGKGDKYFTILDVDDHETSSPEEAALTSERNGFASKEGDVRPENVKDREAGGNTGTSRPEKYGEPVEKKAEMQVDRGAAWTSQGGKNNDQQHEWGSGQDWNKNTHSTTSCNTREKENNSWKNSKEEREGRRKYDEEEWKASNGRREGKKTDDWWKTVANDWGAPKTQHCGETRTSAHCEGEKEERSSKCEEHGKETPQDTRGKWRASLTAEGCKVAERADERAVPLHYGARNVLNEDAIATEASQSELGDWADKKDLARMWCSKNPAKLETQDKRNEWNMSKKDDIATEVATGEQGDWAGRTDWMQKWESNSLGTWKMPNKRNEFQAPLKMEESNMAGLVGGTETSFDYITWNISKNDDAAAEVTKVERSDDGAGNKDWASKWEGNNMTTSETQEKRHEWNMSNKNDAATEVKNIGRGDWAGNKDWASKWEGNNESRLETQEKRHEWNISKKDDTALEATKSERGDWTGNKDWANKWEHNKSELETVEKRHEWNISKKNDTALEATKSERHDRTGNKDWANKWEHNKSELKTEEKRHEWNISKKDDNIAEAAKSEHGDWEGKKGNNWEKWDTQAKLSDRHTALKKEEGKVVKGAQRAEGAEIPFNYSEWSLLKEQTVAEARKSERGEEDADKKDWASKWKGDTRAKWENHNERSEWRVPIPKKEYEAENHRNDLYGSYDWSSKTEGHSANAVAESADTQKDWGESYKGMAATDESEKQTDAYESKKAGQSVAEAKLRHGDMSDAYKANQPVLSRDVQDSWEAPLRDCYGASTKQENWQGPVAADQSAQSAWYTSIMQKQPENAQNTQSSRQAEAATQSTQNSHCASEQKQPEDAQNRQSNWQAQAEAWSTQNAWAWQQMQPAGAQNKQNDWEPPSNVEYQLVTIAQNQQSDWHIENQSTESIPSYYTQHWTQEKSASNVADNRHSYRVVEHSNPSFHPAGDSSAEVYSRCVTKDGSQPSLSAVNGSAGVYASRPLDPTSPPFQPTVDDKAWDGSFGAQHIRENPWDKAAETWGTPVTARAAPLTFSTTEWNANGVQGNNSAVLQGSAASTAREKHGGETTPTPRAGYDVGVEKNTNRPEETDMFVVQPPRYEPVGSVVTSTWNVDVPEWNCTAPAGWHVAQNGDEAASWNVAATAQQWEGDTYTANFNSLLVRVYESKEASVVRKLSAGDKVVARGHPRDVDGISWIPVQPDGFVMASSNFGNISLLSKD